MNDVGPWFARAPFEGLQGGVWDLIMADPPWAFKARSAKGLAKSAQRHYECRDLAWVKSLPVGDLAAKHCCLWLWATNPMLPQQLEVAAAWGFKFSTAGTWVKTTKKGKLCFGTGHVLRGCSEPFLICTRGAPKFSKAVRSAFLGLRREHSRKPAEGYVHAERLVPGAQRRLELFSREDRAGWVSWGDEVGKFAEAA